MKFLIMVLAYFVSFSSSANDSIAEMICNAYKKKENQNKCFTELEKDSPKYISFKFGVSACPEKKYWKEFIDEKYSNNTPEIRGLDTSCLSLREGNIVFGFLNKAYYKGHELVQVKSSDGTLLWLESAAIQDIVISQIEKPEPWLTVLRDQDGRILKRSASH
ncbi:hypothetical protein NQS96_13155 [Pseudoalteromonas shioyasakiensis]|uniref:hypothetical protein n=1 Tax=Pseudoalteromonas shioyasakiensis TaxID=1190813 RepID=UPI002117D53C|nr:hypothetical protein [Pseudoalteromonas shioyasakiensis]MCQ8882722.1 hypothetical protein [Pseudoalteromonas shioyasakiensis]